MKPAVGFANAVEHPAMRYAEPDTELDIGPGLGLGPELELDIEPDMSEKLAHDWRTEARADFLLKLGQDCERSVGWTVLVAGQLGNGFEPHYDTIRENVPTR